MIVIHISLCFLNSDLLYKIRFFLFLFFSIKNIGRKFKIYIPRDSSSITAQHEILNTIFRSITAWILNHKKTAIENFSVFA